MLRFSLPGFVHELILASNRLNTVQHHICFPGYRSEFVELFYDFLNCMLQTLWKLINTYPDSSEIQVTRFSGTNIAQHNKSSLVINDIIRTEIRGPEP